MTSNRALLAFEHVYSLQDLTHFKPNAWSFRDCYYVLVGDSWNVPANEAPHISFVKSASAALKPFVAGNYINRELPLHVNWLSYFKPMSMHCIHILSSCSSSSNAKNIQRLRF